MSTSWRAASRPNSGNDHRRIISLPHKISIQKTRDQSRVFHPDALEGFQIPTSVDPVRVHDQELVGVPGERKLLYFVNLVPHSTVVRCHPPAPVRSHDACRDISYSRKRGDPSFNVQGDYAHGGAPSLFQAIV